MSSMPASESQAPVTMEKDTEDREDIPNLLEFLLPAKEVLDVAISFGIHYNRNIFNGWVKQPSPCCAASSVAGAWNTIHSYHRQDSHAMQHTDVLEIYKSIVQEKLHKKLTAFERKLGSKLSKDFWNEFDEIGKKFGKEIGGKKGFAITKNIADKVLREIVGNYVRTCSSNSSSSKEDTKDNNVPLNFVVNERECILELYKIDGVTFDDTSEVRDEQNIKVADDDEEENDLPSDDEEVPSSGKSNVWQWKTDFMEVIRHKSGLLKLEAERPSTAFIGNWGILDSIASLSETNGLGTLVSARLFMGKKKTTKSKLDIPLSKKDTNDVIDHQWELLRAGFAKPKQVLLLHWNNH